MNGIHCYSRDLSSPPFILADEFKLQNVL